MTQKLKTVDRQELENCVNSMLSKTFGILGNIETELAKLCEKPFDEWSEKEKYYASDLHLQRLSHAIVVSPFIDLAREVDESPDAKEAFKKIKRHIDNILKHAEERGFIIKEKLEDLTQH